MLVSALTLLLFVLPASSLITPNLPSYRFDDPGFTTISCAHGQAQKITWTVLTMRCANNCKYIGLRDNPGHLQERTYMLAYNDYPLTSISLEAYFSPVVQKDDKGVSSQRMQFREMRWRDQKRGVAKWQSCWIQLD